MAKKSKRSSKTMPMRELEAKGVPYQVHAHARKLYTAEDVAEDLGIPLAQVVKAMIVRCSDRSFVLVVIPGDKQLSLKKVGGVLEDKGVELATHRDAERVTGFRVGAVSVLGFRRSDIATYVDQSVLEMDKVIISSGRPDAGLEVNPHDLMPALEAQVGDFAS
jgi:Cys-tRNA(Pro)/Cys-tRNA(Cys) deacylase